jgi:hypothetical protein
MNPSKDPGRANEHTDRIGMTASFNAHAPQDPYFSKEFQEGEPLDTRIGRARLIVNFLMSKNRFSCINYIEYSALFCDLHHTKDLQRRSLFGALNFKRLHLHVSRLCAIGRRRDRSNRAP